MRNVTLNRKLSLPTGTTGEWLSDSGFFCYTIEKPWLENQTDISCIAPGTYVCKWQWSPKHNCNLYHVLDANRTAIEIHSANVQYQLLGCIAPGDCLATFTVNSIANGMPPVECVGVEHSVTTLALLERDLRDDKGNQVDFNLIIVGG